MRVKMTTRLTRVSRKYDPASFRGVPICYAIIWSPCTRHQNLVDFEFERGMKATKILVYSFPRVDFCDIGVQVDRQIAGECIDLILVDEPPSAGKECVPEWAIRTKSR